jgi:hypothetical protein
MGMISPRKSAFWEEAQTPRRAGDATVAELLRLQ